MIRKRKSYTVFGDNSGLELTIRNYTVKRGRVQITRPRLLVRVFAYDGNRQQAKMQCDLVETHRISRVLDGVARSKTDRSIKVLARSQKDTTATLSVEPRQDGCVVVVTRTKGGDTRRIEVRLTRDAALAVAELLRQWLVLLAEEEVISSATAESGVAGTANEVKDVDVMESEEVDEEIEEEFPF